MNKKSILAFGAIFLVQFLFSCDPCDCDQQDYLISYTGLDVTAYNTAGFDNKEVVDSVYRNAFGLSLWLMYTQEEISSASLETGSFGFNVAQACDCVPDDYEFSDPVERIEVYAISGSETSEVTAAFGVYQYNLMPLDEVVLEMVEYPESYNLELLDFEAVPDTAVLRVDVYLASGVKLSDQTRGIHFL